MIVKCNFCHLCGQSKVSNNPISHDSPKIQTQNQLRTGGFDGYGCPWVKLLESPTTENVCNACRSRGRSFNTSISGRNLSCLARTAGPLINWTVRENTHPEKMEQKYSCKHQLGWRECELPCSGIWLQLCLSHLKVKQHVFWSYFQVLFPGPRTNVLCRILRDKMWNDLVTLGFIKILLWQISMIIKYTMNRNLISLVSLAAAALLQLSKHHRQFAAGRRTVI